MGCGPHLSNYIKRKGKDPKDYATRDVKPDDFGMKPDGDEPDPKYKKGKK